MKYIEKSSVNWTVFAFSLLTLFLSFSTYGFIFGVIIIISVIIKYEIKIKIYTSIFGLISIAIAYPFLYERFVMRPIRSQDTGLEFRSSFVNEVISYFYYDPINLIFGVGAVNVDVGSKINITAAVNDGSLFMFLILSFGPFLALILIYYFFMRCVKIKAGAFPALLILLISKASLFWVIIPMVMIFIFNRETKIYRNIR